MTAGSFDAWREIIIAAMKSPLGIIALAILVGGNVVITLFGPQDKSSTKLLAITILFLFWGGLTVVAMYRVEPFVPAGSNQAVNENGKVFSRLASPDRNSLISTISLSPHSAARCGAADEVTQARNQLGSPRVNADIDTSTQPRVSRVAEAQAIEGLIQPEFGRAEEASRAPSLLAQAPPRPGRIDCGTAWTEWLDVGHEPENPCPSGCTRGAELGRKFKVVGFPPHTQVA
jgi:hypothetical protein